jgi:prepilin-type processing-associated H-X9-DG protein
MRRATIVRVLIGLSVLLGFFLLAIPLGRFAIESLNRSKCESNLRAIGQCLLLYANGNGGHLPPDLGTLAWNEDIAPIVFVCPGSNTSAPANLPANQLVTWVNAHSNYVYLGSGIIVPHTSMGFQGSGKVVLAYEKEKHHGKGMNVLFLDSRVDWMSIEAAHRAIDLSEATQATTLPAVSTSSRP